jgi:hypothetical protein
MNYISLRITIKTTKAEKPRKSHPNNVLISPVARVPKAIQIASVEVPEKSRDLDASIFSLSGTVKFSRALLV